MLTKLYHDIHIEKAARGFYVRIGCSTLIYKETEDDIEELICDFADYMRDPRAKTEWYLRYHRRHHLQEDEMNKITTERLGTKDAQPSPPPDRF